MSENSDAESRMQKSIAALKDTFSGLRTGRASAALFDKIRVDAYGDKLPVSQTANISIPEARLVVIQPWDKALLGEIEKAIRASELSLNPSNDGKVIRITIPPLTGERRKELSKLAKAEAEKARVAVRNIRRDANDDLKKQLKDGKLTDRYIAEIGKVLEEKEKEIEEV
jgi:ribosome recycling factor